MFRFSRSHLRWPDALRERCRAFGDRLQVRCEDIEHTLTAQLDIYDIIVTNSFLHHVPDYLGMIQQAIRRLSPRGQFFSFQDPLRYDSLSSFARTFSTFAYLPWRISKGDVAGGLKRRLRRSRGVFLEDFRGLDVKPMLHRKIKIGPPRRSAGGFPSV